jgi:hypothetical protein
MTVYHIFGYVGIAATLLTITALFHGPPFQSAHLFSAEFCGLAVYLLGLCERP